MQAHLWISLACRANISSTGPAAGVTHHREPLRTSPGKFLVEKTDTDTEAAVLEHDMVPLDLHLST